MVREYVGKSGIKYRCLVYVINNALCLQDNRLAIEKHLVSRNEPLAISHQIVRLMAETPEWCCRVNVEILVRKLDLQWFMTGAPFTLVKAGPNIDKEVPELVCKVGVRIDNCIPSVGTTMDWRSLLVQESHKR